jgi:hypothetical protein
MIICSPAHLLAALQIHILVGSFINILMLANNL